MELSNACRNRIGWPSRRLRAFRPPTRLSLAAALLCALGLPPALADRAAVEPAGLRLATQLSLPAGSDLPVLQLGTGDAVEIQVFGRPEFDTTTYVSDNGVVTIPLAGNVPVLGLAPSAAAARIAQALRDGQYLLDPQVSLRLVEFRSQQVSALGEVRNPGRFPIDSRMTILDLLAQAGGLTEMGADHIVLLRPDKQGGMQRYAIDVAGIAEGLGTAEAPRVQGGDSIIVPKAAHYYVYGEVRSPNMYRLDSGTTVVEAIARSGGLTERGSDRRIEIKRRVDDGRYRTVDAALTDRIEADDVVRVKERIF